jgi:hypothetical protein
MKISRVEQHLLHSLDLYLASKRTALRSALKLRAPLQADEAEDLRIHYSNYYVNLISAIESISEVGDFEPGLFLKTLEARFSTIDATSGSDNYMYVRELRNSIVHRGLDIASGAHFVSNFPLLIAPAMVNNKWHDKSYLRFSYYLLGVIELCETVVGPTIEEHINQIGVFNKEPDREEWPGESLKFIDLSTEMPEWAKSMARESLPTVCLLTMHQGRVAKVRERLKPIAFDVPAEVDTSRTVYKCNGGTQ